MSETKWTPGPWGYEDSDNPGMLTAGRDSEGSFIYVADVSLCCGDRWSSEEEEANMALIAAAPDLAAALEALLDHCDGKRGFSTPYHMARAALARARGEEVDRG